MKKQKKLSLNKFKVAQLSNFGKRRIYGGTNVGDDDTTTLSLFSTQKCKKDKETYQDPDQQDIF